MLLSQIGDANRASKNITEIRLSVFPDFNQTCAQSIAFHCKAAKDILLFYQLCKMLSLEVSSTSILKIYSQMFASKSLRRREELTFNRDLLLMF